MLLTALKPDRMGAERAHLLNKEQRYPFVVTHSLARGVSISDCAGAGSRSGAGRPARASAAVVGGRPARLLQLRFARGTSGPVPRMGAPVAR